MADDPALREAAEKAIGYANEAVACAEQIRVFDILPTDLSVEGGELTPTLEVRRPVVNERYAREIDQLYTGGRSRGRQPRQVSGNGL